MRLRSKGAIVFLAIALVALAACSANKGTGGSGSKSDSGTLTIASTADESSWDPSQASSIVPLQYLQPIYDSIVRREPNGKVAPMLAQRWSYNADRTILTLTIRKGVKFSDGTELDANAIKLNLDRFRHGTGAASKVASISSVVATNPSTVTIHLSAPDPSLLEVLGGYPAGFIASPKAIHSGTIATQPVGSGPYTLDKSKTVQGSTYTFVKRQGYWDPSLQKYDNIVIKSISDPTATLNALLSGQVDAAQLTAKTAGPAKKAGMTEHRYPTDFDGLFIYDRAGEVVPALGNVRVRQAINYAIDKKAIVKQVDDGMGSVTSQTFGPSTTAYVPKLDNAYPYNPTKAKELLSAAGYSKGFTVSMPVASGSTDPALTATIGQNLQDVGIKVKWVNIQSDDLLPDVEKRKFPMAYQGNAQYQTWLAIKTLVAPNAILNPFHSSDPKVNSLIATIQKSGNDANAEASAAKQLNTYLTDQAWFAPIHRPDSIFFTDQHTSVSPQTRQVIPSIYNYSPAK